MVGMRIFVILCGLLMGLDLVYSFDYTGKIVRTSSGNLEFVPRFSKPFPTRVGVCLAHTSVRNVKVHHRVGDEFELSAYGKISADDNTPRTFRNLTPAHGGAVNTMNNTLARATQTVPKLEERLTPHRLKSKVGRGLYSNARKGLVVIALCARRVLTLMRPDRWQLQPRGVKKHTEVQAQPRDFLRRRSTGNRIPRNANKLILFVQLLLVRLRMVLSQPRALGKLFLALAGMVLLRNYLRHTKSLTTELAFSAFLQLLASSPERIKQLRVMPSAYLFLLDGRRAITRPVLMEPGLLQRLLDAGVDFASPPAPRNVLGLVGTVAYAAFLWKVTSRMLQGPQDEGAGRRREQLEMEAQYGRLSFSDVAGQDAAKTEVQEVCEMLRNPNRYLSVGARLPSGVLLAGPPGSGKTLLARVTASEARVPFFACAASDFVEVFVGRGPARVRRLFKQAAESAPCIVFIDEIDSIGRSRRMGSMNSEQETTLNQLLTCMDGLETSNNGVIVMAATNRLELLDPALLRAGRFDRLVQCPLPDKAGRLEILKVHTRNLKLAEDVDLDRIAKLTSGMSGADLSALSNEAAIRTVRRATVAASTAAATAAPAVILGPYGVEANKGDPNAAEQPQQLLVCAGDWEGALRAYYSGRGVPLPSLSDIAARGIDVLPSWLSDLLQPQGSKKTVVAGGM